MFSGGFLQSSTNGNRNESSVEELHAKIYNFTPAVSLHYLVN